MTDEIDVHLLRHAHSSHAIAGQRDHQRGLDERGEREAASLRARWERNMPRIDQIVCSTARRARLTLAPLLPLLPDASLRYDDGLYALGSEAYVKAIRDAEAAHAVLLVGHNPTIGQVLRSLCPNDGDRLAGGVGTAYWAVLRLTRDPDGDLRPGHLVELVAPV